MNCQQRLRGVIMSGSMVRLARRLMTGFHRIRNYSDASTFSKTVITLRAGSFKVRFPF